MADHLKTPSKITPAILELCRELCASSVPVYVSTQPSPASLSNECFGNVAGHVKVHGGQVQHGWIIYEWPEVYLEAMFHAVWRRPDGQLVDVSITDEPKNLFLPDPIRTYHGQRTPSQQRALTDSAFVVSVIDACRELWAYEALYWHDDGVNPRIIPPSKYAAMVYFYLQRRRAIAQLQLQGHVLSIGSDRIEEACAQLRRSPSRLIEALTENNSWG